MRILTFLNVSNRSRMQADSGYIFYNLLSPYFTKQNSFYFASPEPLSDCNCIHINNGTVQRRVDLCFVVHVHILFIWV